MYTLPPLFYLIYAVMEPISMLSGFLYIIMSPEAFLAEQMPLTPEQTATLTPNAKASLLQLANCYLLLSMCSTAVLRSAGEECVVRRFLFALLLGDIGHVKADASFSEAHGSYFTYVAVGADYFFSPSEWNLLTHGNLTFTIFLFLSRCVYLLGWGGGNARSQGTIKAKSN
ncbi:unnamed protein product [Tuber aestivum]|uniref:DUF7704 domain-containing protein n=1 Tax=Tuber aestivum TaxID=59557 RepID=A0A292PMB7_9PEZI|nr:unnamed protein product [Tuber aestivum]